MAFRSNALTFALYVAEMHRHVLGTEFRPEGHSRGSTMRPECHITPALFFFFSEVTQHTTLVIDISDSMRGRPLQLLAESINDLILSFKKTDYVTIWTFNSDIYKLIAFRQAKNVRLDRLSRDLEKHCGQLTRLYDCISEAHTELCQHVEGSFKPRPHARFLVVFTDGEDNRSSKTASQVCTALENSPVPFLRTIFITAGLRTSSDVFKAVPAGGKIFRAETDQGLFQAFSKLAALQSSLAVMLPYTYLCVCMYHLPSYNQVYMRFMVLVTHLFNASLADVLCN